MQGSLLSSSPLSKTKDTQPNLFINKQLSKDGTHIVYSNSKMKFKVYEEDLKVNNSKENVKKSDYVQFTNPSSLLKH